MLDYIKGMDISSLDEIEKLGAKFYDHGKEGDLIQIDVDKRILAIVGVKGESKTPEEIEEILKIRRQRWKAKPPKYKSGTLRLFSEHAAAPMKGAYLEFTNEE